MGKKKDETERISRGEPQLDPYKVSEETTPLGHMYVLQGPGVRMEFPVRGRFSALSRAVFLNTAFQAGFQAGREDNTRTRGSHKGRKN